jgi:hypothetical protein
MVLAGEEGFVGCVDGWVGVAGERFIIYYIVEVR